MSESLTPGELRFVEAFLRDLDAPDAAIRAGAPTARGARAASTALAKPAVQKAIARAYASRPPPTITVGGRIIAELEKIADADIGTVASWDSEGELILASLRDLSPDQGAAIHEIRRTPGGGIRVKMYSKRDALEKLARHFKLYRDEPAEPESALSPEEQSAALRRRLAAIFGSALGESKRETAAGAPADGPTDDRFHEPNPFA